jgi:TRAP-type C4-dicarboxylate transport system substrate-binding protein
MNFAAYCPYVTRTSIQVYPFIVFMNKSSWEDLPQGVKEVLAGLGPEQATWTGKYMDRHVQEAIDWAKKEHDLKIYPFSKDDQAAIQPKLDALVQDWVQEAKSEGLPAQKILKDIQDLIQAKGQ